MGIISVASVFPAGIIQQRRTQDDVLGPVVAEAALGTLRAKLSQSDFGTFEQFGFFDYNAFAVLGNQGFPNSWLAPADTNTQLGDWPWIRPSVAAVPLNTAPSQWPSYAGDIDIFSARVAHASTAVGTFPDFRIPNYPAALQWADGWRTTELASFGGAFPLLAESYGNPGTGNPELDPEAFLFGIPYNRLKYSLIEGGLDPLVTVKQRERFWPMGSGFGPGQQRPEFAWDCMFRRYQGRVQVAIFVYRVNAANTPGGYAVCQDAGNLALSREVTRPPLPARVDLAECEDAGLVYQPFTVVGGDPAGNSPANRNIVPETVADFNSPNNLISLDPYFEGWQAPGQWIVDPYSRIHRVLQGRRNKRQGPVRLSRPIPEQLPSSTLVNPANAQDFDEWQDLVNEVRSIWFIPTSDRRGIGLEPIYVAVRDL